MPKFTQIPVETFKQLQINAGMLLSRFDPQTAPVEADKLGATTGGVNFTATPTYSDYGEDIDNCPKNTMELKRQDDVEVKMSGTFVTISTESCKRLISAADISSTNPNKIIPRRDLKLEDFQDLHWVGDYGATDGSYIHIRVMNALSTGGFQLQSTDKAKGQFAFEFTGHYSMSEQDVVPYEIEIVNKTEEEAESYEAV